MVKTSQGHTLVVWEDRRKGTVDLGFRRSADMGASWDPLLFLAASSVQESEPALAASGDLALVSWIAHQEGKYAVMYRRSSDGGISWSSSSSLARSTTKLSHPVIAADAEVVLVGWLDRGRENEDFAVRRSVDRGDTFEASWFLVRTPVDDSEPVLLLSGTDAFAAWAEALDRNWRFSSRRSPNAGGAWESTLRLGRTSIRKTYMACDSDELHVACAWMATLDDHPMPVTLHSIDGGRRWQGTWPLE